MGIDIIWDIMHREIRIYVYYNDGKERRFFSWRNNYYWIVRMT